MDNDLQVKAKESELLLTPARRARLAQVRAILAARELDPTAETPYTELAEKGQKGVGERLTPLEIKQKNEQLRLLREQRREATIPNLEAKWSYREPPAEPDVPLLGVSSMFEPYIGHALEPDPTKLLCTFCKSPVDHILATRGKTSRMMRVDEIVEDELGKHEESKFIFISKKSVACPKCCLKITPTVHKDGSLTNNIVWPETEG